MAAVVQFEISTVYIGNAQTKGGYYGLQIKSSKILGVDPLRL